MNTYTLEQFINQYSNDNISYSSLSILNPYDHNIIVYNIIDDYLEIIDKYCRVVNLSDEEHSKYMYKPKLLSYDLYRNTELFFLILKINKMSNIKEFNKRKIKLIPAKDIINIISEIKISEENTIKKNRNKVNKYKSIT